MTVVFDRTKPGGLFSFFGCQHESLGPMQPITEETKTLYEQAFGKDAGSGPGGKRAETWKCASMQICNSCHKPAVIDMDHTWNPEHEIKEDIWVMPDGGGPDISLGRRYWMVKDCSRCEVRNYVRQTRALSQEEMRLEDKRIASRHAATQASIPAAAARRVEGLTRKDPTKRKDLAKYDVFLSHASEDKEAIARPLYEALTAQGVSVWFDEAVLKMGDSLSAKIDEGLVKCDYGLIIISPSFLDKKWPQRELAGLVAREIAGGTTRILPIWHDIDHSALVQRSPTLADRVAGKSIEGIPELVKKILEVIR